MLIGVDMNGIRPPKAGRCEACRLARRLASALLAGDRDNEYLVYDREGPATLRRVLEDNPDGLDWLLLLDPFADALGEIPPESPIDGVKVASLIADLAPGRVDDRRLAPLRTHEALFACGEATADACRRRLHSAARRVIALEPGCDEAWLADDSGAIDREELGRLGVEGPYLLASPAVGRERSSLFAVLEGYSRLPVDLREAHRLVVAGDVLEPWEAVAFLHEGGCAEGLVLVGPVEDAGLRALYDGCSAFVAPGLGEGSDLALVEAMGRGAAIVAGDTDGQAEVVGHAGLLVDAADPSEVAGRVARVLTDPGLRRELGSLARSRAAGRSWDSTIAAILDAFRSGPPAEPGPRRRVDRPRQARPRISGLADPSRIIPGTAASA